MRRTHLIVAFVTILAPLIVVTMGCGGTGKPGCSAQMSGVVYVREGVPRTGDNGQPQTPLDDDIRVTDSTTPPEGFRPFVGATVKVVGTGYNHVTGERGLFAFDQVPGGTWTIEISAPGFPTVTRQKTVSC